MSIQKISAAEAWCKIQQGAKLIDIRNCDEYAREHIEEAQLVPLGEIEGSALADADTECIIFHCKSGMRTQTNAELLARAAGNCSAYTIDGGIEAWKKVGLPVITDRKQPLELMRQVQIAAGSLVLVGILGGILVSPYFYGLSAFVGAGLIFAGISGFCGMAHLLKRMPWNRAMR